MKKIFLIMLFGLVIITACKTTKGLVDIKPLNQNELVEWSYNNDTIYKNNLSVGILQPIEWEYVEGGMVRQEISVTQLNHNADTTLEIIRYIYTRYPKAKIEINFE